MHGGQVHLDGDVHGRAAPSGGGVQAGGLARAEVDAGEAGIPLDHSNLLNGNGGIGAHVESPEVKGPVLRTPETALRRSLEREKALGRIAVSAAAALLAKCAGCI
jgi:hypothetical protein